MRPPNYVFSGLLGAIIACIVWVVVISQGGPIYVNLFCAILIGISVRSGARSDQVGMHPGFVAGVLTCLCLFVGMTILVQLLVHKTATNSVPEWIIRDAAIAMANDDEAAGHKLEWPTGKNVQTARMPADFPEGVYEAAQSWWDSLTTSQKNEAISELTPTYIEHVRNHPFAMGWSRFKAMYEGKNSPKLLIAFGFAFFVGGMFARPRNPDTETDTLPKLEL